MVQIKFVIEGVIKKVYAPNKTGADINRTVSVITRSFNGVTTFVLDEQGKILDEINDVGDGLNELESISSAIFSLQSEYGSIKDGYELYGYDNYIKLSSDVDGEPFVFKISTMEDFASALRKIISILPSEEADFKSSVMYAVQNDILPLIKEYNASLKQETDVDLSAISKAVLSEVKEAFFAPAYAKIKERLNNDGVKTDKLDAAISKLYKDFKAKL